MCNQSSIGIFQNRSTSEAAAHFGLLKKLTGGYRIRSIWSGVKPPEMQVDLKVLVSQESGKLLKIQFVPIPGGQPI
jgi:hypothetical protein